MSSLWDFYVIKDKISSNYCITSSKIIKSYDILLYFANEKQRKGKKFCNLDLNM